MFFKVACWSSDDLITFLLYLFSDVKEESTINNELFWRSITITKY